MIIVLFLRLKKIFLQLFISIFEIITFSQFVKLNDREKHYFIFKFFTIHDLAKFSKHIMMIKIKKYLKLNFI